MDSYDYQRLLEKHSLEQNLSKDIFKKFEDNSVRELSELIQKARDNLRNSHKELDTALEKASQVIKDRVPSDNKLKLLKAIKVLDTFASDSKELANIFVKNFVSRKEDFESNKKGMFLGNIMKNVLGSNQNGSGSIEATQSQSLSTAHLFTQHKRREPRDAYRPLFPEDFSRFRSDARKANHKNTVEKQQSADGHVTPNEVGNNPVEEKALGSDLKDSDKPKLHTARQPGAGPRDPRKSNHATDFPPTAVSITAKTPCDPKASKVGAKSADLNRDAVHDSRNTQLKTESCQSRPPLLKRKITDIPGSQQQVCQNETRKRSRFQEKSNPAKGPPTPKLYILPKQAQGLWKPLVKKSVASKLIEAFSISQGLPCKTRKHITPLSLLLPPTKQSPVIDPPPVNRIRVKPPVKNVPESDQHQCPTNASSQSRRQSPPEEPPTVLAVPVSKTTSSALEDPHKRQPASAVEVTLSDPDRQPLKQPRVQQNSHPPAQSDNTPNALASDEDNVAPGDNQDAMKPAATETSQASASIPALENVANGAAVGASSAQVDTAPCTSRKQKRTAIQTLQDAPQEVLGKRRGRPPIRYGESVVWDSSSKRVAPPSQRSKGMASRAPKKLKNRTAETGPVPENTTLLPTSAGTSLESIAITIALERIPSKLVTADKPQRKKGAKHKRKTGPIDNTRATQEVTDSCIPVNVNQFTSQSNQSDMSATNSNREKNHSTNPERILPQILPPKVTSLDTKSPDKKETIDGSLVLNGDSCSLTTPAPSTTSILSPRSFVEVPGQDKSGAGIVFRDTVSNSVATEEDLQYTTTVPTSDATGDPSRPAKPDNEKIEIGNEQVQSPEGNELTSSSSSHSMIKDCTPLEKPSPEGSFVDIINDCDEVIEVERSLLLKCTICEMQPRFQSKKQLKAHYALRHPQVDFPELDGVEEARIEERVFKTEPNLQVVTTETTELRSNIDEAVIPPHIEAKLPVLQEPVPGTSTAPNKNIQVDEHLFQDRELRIEQGSVLDVPSVETAGPSRFLDGTTGIEAAIHQVASTSKSPPIAGTGFQSANLPKRATEKLLLACVYCQQRQTFTDSEEWIEHHRLKHPEIKFQCAHCSTCRETLPIDKIRLHICKTVTSCSTTITKKEME